MGTIDMRRRPSGSQGPRFALSPALMVPALWSLSCAQAAEIPFQRAYQGSLSGTTFATMRLLKAAILEAAIGSVRFSDGRDRGRFDKTVGAVGCTVNEGPRSDRGMIYRGPAATAGTAVQTCERTMRPMPDARQSFCSSAPRAATPMPDAGTSRACDAAEHVRGSRDSGSWRRRALSRIACGDAAWAGPRSALHGAADVAA